MVDVDDKDAVLAEMADELGEDAEDLSIEADTGIESFGVGTAWRVQSGRREWVVVQDDDVARDLAIEIVKQDLDDQPEIFNRSLIESHINIERLRRDLSDDVQNMVEEDLREMRESDFWREAEGYGVEPTYRVQWSTPDSDGTLPGQYEDEDEAAAAGEEWKERAFADADPEDEYEEDDFEYWTEAADPTEDQISEVAEAITEARLRDPMQYLEDIYGREDAVKQAIEIAGIDIDAAAEDAVDTDGAGHFVSSYDGEIYDTPQGLCYWRAQ